jgi:soluble lytic murein transglycosylase-like protein
MRILIAAVMALVMTMTAYAEAPKIIMSGEYVIDAIDITEPPPINNISNALNALDALDDTPYNAQVPLSNDLQRYIWDKCKAATGDYKNMYVFILGLIDAESEFNPRAVSKTHDYGLTQTNRKYVYPDVKKVFGLTDITDCFDPYVSVDCCFWELSKKLNSYGVTERLYYYYNTGNTKGSSNANSRRMLGKWQKWESIIWG